VLFTATFDFDREYLWRAEMEMGQLVMCHGSPFRMDHVGHDEITAQ